MAFRMLAAGSRPDQMRALRLPITMCLYRCMTDDKTSHSRHQHHHKRKRWFDRFSSAVTRAAGSSRAFLLAITVVLVWGVSGPIFGFSDTWQLVINTGTTIITFLMVFLIQNTQKAGSEGIHIKLDELIRSHHAAQNQLLDLEELSQDQLDTIRTHYADLAEKA